MKPFELDKALNSNANIAHAFMFFGDSHFLIDHYIKRLAKLFSNGGDALNLYHQDYNFTTAKEHLSQSSLFGGNNLLIIKSEKKIPKKELDELVAYTQKSPTNFFLYGYYGSDFKTSNKSFTKKSVADNVRLFPPNFNAAMELLKTEATHLNIQIDNYVLAHLYNSQNGDISLAVNELPKLAIIGRPIESKDIDALVYSLAEVKLDDLIASLLDKKEFRIQLERILESGEDPIRIITAISGFITQLFMFVAHMKIEGNADSRAILGYKLPQFIEDARANQAKRFKLGTYHAMMTLLLENELAMKQGGQHDNEALLFSTLIKLQAFI